MKSMFLGSGSVPCWYPSYQSGEQEFPDVQVYECFDCIVSVQQLYAWYPRKPEKGIGYFGNGVIDSCELPCGCWESNPGPLQEQQVLLTMGPSLQP
ncbi:E3 ubiquitin-protein ligase [Cricetulus griseus]|uniref:E3 ubiquitin-protein ligase n=1 Tax=Cricetulus griseus TaxID=10029 RepID=A0A061II55_CRIGR|nr:E3 ubiquitin-protein ligase [Cricetulus griseus]